MMIMMNSAQSRIRGTKAPSLPAPNVASLCLAINLGEEVWSRDMNLVRADADYWTVSLVHITNFEQVLTATNAVVVKLVPNWSHQLSLSLDLISQQIDLP